MANVPIRDITLTGTPAGPDYLVFDNGQMRKGTFASAADAIRPVASQAEAQAGADNTKTMTPMRVKDSIAAEVNVTIASKAQGDLAATALQPAAIGTTVQPFDADLSAIAALGSSGFATRINANTWAQRSFVPPAEGITITNPSGIAGDPTFALANDLAALEALGSSGFATRINSDTWAQRDLVPPSSGITITNPGGVAGNPTFALADDLAALEALTGTNTIYYRSGTNAWSPVLIGSNLAFSGGTLSATGGGGGSAALPTRYWQGYTHSNSVGSPNTVIDVSAGSARDSTDTADLVNASGSINCATVGANGLDAGSLANNTWYYTFAIATAGGATALLASTSATAPTLPATYTKFRRIGSFKTNGSAQILAFTHVNDQWWWSSSPRDVNTTALGTTRTLFALSVPRVQGVWARYAATVINAAAVSVSIYPGFLPSGASNGTVAYNGTSGVNTGETQVDSSGQIYAVSTSASTTLVIDLAGWRDQL